MGNLFLLNISRASPKFLFYTYLGDSITKCLNNFNLTEISFLYAPIASTALHLGIEEEHIILHESSMTHKCIFVTSTTDPTFLNI